MACGVGRSHVLVKIYVAELFAYPGGLSPARKRIRWGNPDHGFSSFCFVSCSCSGDRVSSSGALGSGYIVSQLFSLCGAGGGVGGGVGCGVGGGVDADGVRRYDWVGGVECGGGFGGCGVDQHGFDQHGVDQHGVNDARHPRAGVAFGTCDGFSGWFRYR